MGMLARVAALSGWRADMSMLLAGMVSALALPPIYAIPALLIGIPCLLAAVGATARWRGAFRRGWWFGLGLNVVGLYWITEAILFEAERFWWLVPLAVPALSAVMALFIGLAAVVARHARGGWPRAFALAGAWTLTDLARQFILSGFPWNPLGSVWELPNGFGDVMIQPAAAISVHGLTLITLLLAAAPCLGWRWRGAAVATLLLWAGAGIARLDRQPEGSDPEPNVVVVQGNVPQGQKWNRALVDSIFNRYLALSGEGLRKAGPGPAVVVWPETASPYQLETDAPARDAIVAVTGSAIPLVGSVRFDRDGRPRNTLFALAPNGDISQKFDKWHLVPFGEYQPTWLSIGIQLVPGGGFAPGPGPVTLDPPGIPPVGPLICYEAIFPGQVVDRSHRPAWLANVTNDAWFGNSSGPRQHLAAARMRAVEEGLPLIRAANTGISAIFDAHGHEIARLGMGLTGVLVERLPRALPPTLFARFGLPVPGCLALAAMLVGLIGWRREPIDR
jgi:apolipoprotein N-acyltransferase